MYCQKLCGEADFSIDEYNKAQEDLKTLTPEQLEFVVDSDTSGMICQKQCADCAAIVAKRKKETNELLNNKNPFKDLPCNYQSYGDYCNPDACNCSKSWKWQDENLSK